VASRALRHSRASVASFKALKGKRVGVHEAVPAELVYALTQVLLDHAEEVRAAYPTAAAMTRANAGRRSVGFTRLSGQPQR
jgi:hypothetical protein